MSYVRSVVCMTFNGLVVAEWRVVFVGGLSLIESLAALHLVALWSSVESTFLD